MTERQYKDSGIGWIGDIPNDWEVIKIKYLQDTSQKDSFIDGDWIESPYIIDSGIRYLTSGNIGDGVFKRQGNGYISGKTFEVLNCKYAYPNDLIISRLNAPYGRACILPNDENKYVLAVDNVILRTKQNKQFLCYVMQCDGYHSNVEEKSAGTAMKRISRSKLGHIQLPLPSLEEQQQIANFLDSKTASIDSAIQAQKDIVEKLKEYKQAVITEAVTKGLNRDVEMKDSKTNGVDKIPATWEDMKIKYLGSFCNGLTYHPEDICGEDEGTLVLRSSNIQDGKLNFNDNVYVKCSIPAKIRVKKGDIIICSRNGSAKLIGKNALVTNDMNATFGAFMMMFRCDSPRYMYYVLNSKTWETYLSLFATTTINQLTSTTFGNLLFPYTFDKEEQCRIVEYLDSKTARIDRAIEQKNAIIEKLEEYKKSIIYNAVTGKIDCRKDVIPE